MTKFDLCVLTAANEQQALGYRKQLDWRRTRGMLSDETRFLVIADPQGKRIGSGASTIYVLFELLHQAKDEMARAFRKKRILILHSGGDSRRLPAYSAVGKLFVPLPSKKYYALFDAIFDHFQELPVQDQGQVIVASGDVLLSFDTSQLVFHDSGVTGVAYPENTDVAQHHGVYIGQLNHQPGRMVKVLDFLQKPTPKQLEQAHALDLSGKAFVDTGIMNFSMDAVEKFLHLDALDCKIRDGKVSLDLYREIVFAMLGKETNSLLPDLNTIPFHVSLLPYCGFFHIGKSIEFLHNFYSVTQAGALCDFSNQKSSNVSSVKSLKNAYVYNSIISTESISIQEPVIIEGCTISNPLQLQGNNILTNIPASNCDIMLKKNLCLTVMPLVKHEWVAILYGIHDNFKGSLDDKDCLFMNTPLHQWLGEKGIAADDLWQKNEPRQLWNARLFPVDVDVDRVINSVLLLQSGSVREWQNSGRISMRDVLAKANQEQILEMFSDLDRQDRLLNIGRELSSDDMLSSQKIVDWCKTDTEFKSLLQRLQNISDIGSDPLFKARIAKLRSMLYDKFQRNEKVDEMENHALALVHQAVQSSLASGSVDFIPKIQIRTDEVVWACASARLDFAGGWSDTPPYCFEHGGIVLNAAVKLNGQYPIQAIGKIYSESAIRINSIDLGANKIISTAEEMLSFSDPSDWLSLPKAAFVASGVLPNNPSLTLSHIIRNYGHGIDLTLFSALPSGSGLGTSSILGSAIIACLARLFGIIFSPNELFQRTLYMEQLMTTGGGWQDQIGGVVGGVKLIQTQRGLTQNPVISWTGLNSPYGELADRFLLYYTGYRRMAKNILKQIVGRYLARDAVTLETIFQLKQSALSMKENLDQRNFNDFGSQIAQVWELNKRLDEGSSNRDIEGILEKIKKNIYGAKLLGAGGGGFLFIVSRSKEDSNKIRDILTHNPPNDRARFFDFEIDNEGLKVSVL